LLRFTWAHQAKLHSCLDLLQSAGLHLQRCPWLGFPIAWASRDPTVLLALLGLLLVELEGRHGHTVQDLSPGEQTSGYHRRAALVRALLRPF